MKIGYRLYCFTFSDQLMESASFKLIIFYSMEWLFVDMPRIAGFISPIPPAIRVVCIQWPMDPSVLFCPMIIAPVKFFFVKVFIKYISSQLSPVINWFCISNHVIFHICPEFTNNKIITACLQKICSFFFWLYHALSSHCLILDLMPAVRTFSRPVVFYAIHHHILFTPCTVACDIFLPGVFIKNVILCNSHSFQPFLPVLRSFPNIFHNLIPGGCSF